MTGQFIGLLLRFVLSPEGIITIAVCFIMVLRSRSSRRAAWFLYALCCFAASLGAFASEYIVSAPALVFPLEQMRAAGRPLTIVILVALVLIGLRSRPTHRVVVPRPVMYILLVQSVIVVKTILFGSFTFALLTVGTLGAVVLMLIRGPSAWLETDDDFGLAAWSIATAAVLFLAASLYQGLFDIYPLTFVHGRFLGTSPNPQYAGLYLAATLPCILYAIEVQEKTLIRLFWAGVGVLSGMALIWTGSRTGVLMGLVSLVVFYRVRIGSLLQLLLVVGVLAMLFSLASNSLGVDLNAIWDVAGNRFTAVENTRSQTWNALWTSFQANPIFGTPLYGDRLMGYGESSWLGTASALGVVGVIPLLLAGYESLRMLLQLLYISRHRPSCFAQTSAVMAGLTTLYVGSLFEAILLGNLSSSVLFLFLYLVMGQYLIDTKFAEVAPQRPIQSFVLTGLNKDNPITRSIR